MHLKATIEMDFIKLIKDFQGIVLYVTHDINEAFRICDDIITFDNGLSNNKRNKHDIFNSPSTLSEAKLTGCNNISKAYKIDDHLVFAEDWGLKILF